MFQPRLIVSAAQPRAFPADRGREVAVAGRSNSGKSSAVNRIVGRRKLARVSKTPGRTQLINFFELAPERRLVDLPGYGFARVSPETRQRWRVLVEAYFEGRRSLCGLIVTVDVRRGLMDSDVSLLAWAQKLRVPQLLLLTKADKLSRGAALTQQGRIAEQAPGGAKTLLFSASSGLGADRARAELVRWLDLEDGASRA